MILSKRGDYVLRSALCLARTYDEHQYRKLREIVLEMEVPRTYASQILSDLVRADIAFSKAGKSGGYQLTRDPSSISVLEVIEAAEGPLHAERCAMRSGPCRWEVVCPLHETWLASTESLRTTLANESLATLVERDRMLEAGTYPLPEVLHRRDI